MDARKFTSFDIPIRDNIHQYQCNKPIILSAEIFTQHAKCFIAQHLPNISSPYMKGSVPNMITIVNTFSS